MSSEVPVCFGCEGDLLYGILHAAAATATRGVLIVVGGPQYRVGSHRQFVLLARHLADTGVPVLRFDYRGMGDSEGEARSFEEIEPDIRAAIDKFVECCPGLREIVLWGLCDAASASLFYAHKDARVTGLVLVNPWARTEAGIAGAYLRQYYVTRLVDPALWRKIFRGEFQFRSAVASFTGLVAARLGLGTARRNKDRSAAPNGRPLPERMLAGWEKFSGRVLLILSGDDLTAEEFRDVTRRSRAWQRMLRDARVTTQELKEANHTFSRAIWRDQAATWTREWLGTW